MRLASKGVEKFLGQEFGYTCRIANNQEILPLRFLTLLFCMSKATQVAILFSSRWGKGIVKCFMLLAFVLMY